MAYVEFTHSQNQQSLHQGLLNAFAYWGGSTEQIVVDNMLTAVIERQGSLIRFSDVFLDFLRIFHITPIACNVAAPHEKGKIENVIKYLRQNFWPLRTFTALYDVNRQVINWLDTLSYPGYTGIKFILPSHQRQDERKSTAIRTNRPFAQWGEIFDNTTVATAIADRLVYNSEILILEGSSYRKRIKD